MSYVTGILICFSCMEDFKEQSDGSDKFPLIKEINSWLKAQDKLPLAQLDDAMCRGKHPQMYVFGGGYNYLDDEGFLALFHNLPWQEPEEVFLIFNPENASMRVIQPEVTICSR